MPAAAVQLLAGQAGQLTVLVVLGAAVALAQVAQPTLEVAVDHLRRAAQA
jgi:hypothetical protein